MGKTKKRINMTPQELKDERKKLNLTQKQLATELGLSKNGDVYIRKVEGGRGEPSGLLIRCFELYIDKCKVSK